MTRFRPCIDLHSGQVKQIVGATLSDRSSDLKTNFISQLPTSHFVKLYKDNGLSGGHVIMLGPGNEDAVKEALAEWPQGLHIGGGITKDNAQRWIDLGAQKVRSVHLNIESCSDLTSWQVIVTSYLFPDGSFSIRRLTAMLGELKGDRCKLVIDLSCRKKNNRWVVAMNKWQTLTDMEVNQGL